MDGPPDGPGSRGTRGPVRRRAYRRKICGTDVAALGRLTLKTQLAGPPDRGGPGKRRILTELVLKLQVLGTRIGRNRPLRPGRAPRTDGNAGDRGL